MYSIPSSPVQWASNLSLTAAFLCVVALATLAVGSAARRAVRRHWITSLFVGALGIFLAIPAMLDGVQWMHEAASGPRIERNAPAGYIAAPSGLQVDGLAIPTGTYIEPPKTGRPGVITGIWFDPPMSIRGVRVRHATRNDDAPRSVAGNWSIRASAGEEEQGPVHAGRWLCEGDLPMSMLGPLAGKPAAGAVAEPGLTACILAAGNQAGGIRWPAGTRLTRIDSEAPDALQGMAGADGASNEQAVRGRWRLEGPPALKEWLGFPVRGLVAEVDDEGRLVACHAYLTLAVKVGEFRYQPFTRIAKAGELLAFHPDRHAPAARDDGSTVDETHSVLQTRAGQVRDIIPTNDPVDLQLRHFLD